MSDSATSDIATAEIKELLERFRQSPSVLEKALDGVTEEESKFSPAPGKWTIREIVRHVADTEFLAGVRLRQMIAEDRPDLAMFDQDKWAVSLKYNDSDPRDALLDFGVLREMNTTMLAAVPPEAYDREGIHAKRGVTTLRFWVDLFAKHIDKHAQQILVAREAFAKRAR